MPGRRRNLDTKAIDPDRQATRRAALELGAADEHLVAHGYADLLTRPILLPR